MSAARSARSIIVILVLLMVTFAVLYLNVTSGTLAEEVPAAGLDIRANAGSPASRTAGNTVQVALVAPYSTTSWDERDPGRVKFEIPLVYLRHQRQASAAPERTIELRISGPVSAARFRIEATSYHADAATGQRHRAVWDLGMPKGPCTGELPCSIQWTLDAETLPSDFYRLRLTDLAGQTLWENAHVDRPDLVALDTWDVPVSPPYTVRIIYAALFPYGRADGDLGNQLPTGAVAGFIEGSFAPLISETWRTQVDDWGFGQPLHPDWDHDAVVEVIVNAAPFALMDGSGTYTILVGANDQPYLERRIWWRSSMAAYGYYDTLENGYRALFAHEFFHLMQWNVLLNAGVPKHLWLGVFIEPQADFAISAQYPELELDRTHLVTRVSDYGASANRYLAHYLNSSYADSGGDGAQRYDLALYWRFLYEQYGGMDIVRAALEELASGAKSPDVVSEMAEVMNNAFARCGGPFPSFEASLEAFARANYGLRLENGRCAQQGPGVCAGRLYDPQALYSAPMLEAFLQIDGRNLTALVGKGDWSDGVYHGTIPASYGMDFIEVDLETAAAGQPMTIRVQGKGQTARFSVQVWRLRRGDLFPVAVASAPEAVAQGPDGVYTIAVPQAGSDCNRLALIITRIDPNETMDSAGAYSVTVN
jgi:hypothetical protein